MRIRFKMLRHAVKPLVASIIMGGVVCLVYSIVNFLMQLVIKKVYLDNLIALIFAAAAGMFVYFIFLALIRGIRKSDLNAFPSKLRRLIPKSIMAMVK